MTDQTNSCGPLLPHNTLQLSQVHSIAHWVLPEPSGLIQLSPVVTEVDLHKVAYVASVNKYYGLVGVFPAQWELLSGDNVSNFVYIDPTKQIQITLISGDEFIISLQPLVDQLTEYTDSSVGDVDTALRDYVNTLINQLDVPGTVANAITIALDLHNEDELAHPKLERNLKELIELETGDNPTDTKVRYFADSTDSPVNLILPALFEETAGYDEDLELSPGQSFEVLTLGEDVTFSSDDLDAVVKDQRPTVAAGDFYVAKVTLLNDGDSGDGIPAMFDGIVYWLIT